ncbi:hypothetical protein J6590_099555 [Homalodisca vitripennis]|nr:hypothetical protein J6590_067676 [Homalodisca vitripennis]KAG8274820.1 hypothetical protein J6590_099555 [Homalodisca vitripennis]
MSFKLFAVTSVMVILCKAMHFHEKSGIGRFTDSCSTSHLENIVISDISEDESVQPEIDQIQNCDDPNFVPQNSTEPHLIKQNERNDMVRDFLAYDYKNGIF